MANLLQSSRSTFSRGRFSSFFAFQEGMWDTQISALLSSPTVSAPFLRLPCLWLLSISNAKYINYEDSLKFPSHLSKSQFCKVGEFLRQKAAIYKTPVIYTRCERGSTAGATCTETQCSNQCRVGGWSGSFCTRWWVLEPCKKRPLQKILRANGYESSCLMSVSIYNE